MHERLIIDGNSVYEVDEECLKRRNVPTECRLWNVRSRKKKPQKKDSILYAKRDADTASLFGCAPCCTRF